MAEAKRKLVAILAADVAGYSRLMGDDERATMNRLIVCRDVFRKHISDHEGRVVDTAGDSVLATFPSVVEAVSCAVNVQSDLGKSNAGAPEDRRMLFRIGVNLGDVFNQEDGTIYGDGVNIAARLEGLAEPGGIAVSEDAYRQVEGKTELVFQDVGEHPVKNIVRPVRAYRVLTNAQSTASAPAKGEAASERPSIAVLAFDDLSGDPAQEYFADGIAEDLITELSRFRWLRITARNSSFTYKGQAVDVRQVGRDLGVRYVVEGSVRKGGERLRITAQLIETDTGNHLWAERYDRDLADIFALQDEITETLVAALQVELGEVERARARRKPPNSLDAWEAFQRALWHLHQIDAENVSEGLRLLRRAIDLDANFAQAHAYLAFALFLEITFGYTTVPLDDLDHAFEAATKAVKLDDKEAMAHFAMGRLHTITMRYDSAETALRLAVDLCPSSALAHYGLAFLLAFSGRPEQSLGEFDTALRLSPRDPAAWAFYGSRCAANLFLGNYEDAVTDSRQAMQFPAAHPWPYFYMASSLGHLGRNVEAREALAHVSRMNPSYSLRTVLAALSPLDPNASRPLLEPLFEGLRMAGLNITDELGAT